MTFDFTSIDAQACSAAEQEALNCEVGSVAQTCPLITLEIGVFFDGTNNNETNSAIGGSGGSYGNAVSNVVLLKNLYKHNVSVPNSCGGIARKYSRIYVDGIGTYAGDDDNTFPGGALGMGDSGVESRVFQTCVEVGNRIKAMSPGVEPEKIIMDVFGFSRGAAAARYFVNCFRQGFIEYYKNYIDLKKAYLPEGRTVEFRSIGIFDTVAAIGIGSNDDNRPVNVHLSTAQADKIFHLNAGNEYRKNFRLNHNIPGGGTAREMPGAHSDVGGGYKGAGDFVALSSTRSRAYYSRSTATNARLRVAAAKPPARYSATWEKEGWIYPNEPNGGVVYKVNPIVRVPGDYLTIGGFGQDQYYFSYSVVLDRPWVQPGLSRVPLKIMYDEAKKADVPLLSAPTRGEWEIPANLKPYAAKLVGGGSLSATEKNYVLRNYGHVSSTRSIGMGADKNHIRVVYPNEPGKAK